MHNIASYKKINRRCSLEISELNTQDISKFISHLWETIWYFRKCNIQENPSQPAIRMGFAHSNGDEMCYYIKTEKKNSKYLIRSFIWTRLRKIGTDKEYTHVFPKPSP